MGLDRPDELNFREHGTTANLRIPHLDKRLARRQQYSIVEGPRKDTQQEIGGLVNAGAGICQDL
jgi:hypothetical protein